MTFQAILEAVRYKYGSGTEEVRRIDFQCANASSNGNIGIQKLETWRNGDILAATYSGFIYDKACRLNSTKGFFVEQTPKVLDLDDCEHQGWIKAQAVKENKKKESLKDF